MHGFDTTIQLANLRRDELVQSATRARTARTARAARSATRRLGRRVRHGFPASTGSTV